MTFLKIVAVGFMFPYMISKILMVIANVVGFRFTWETLKNLTISIGLIPACSPGRSSRWNGIVGHDLN